MIRKILEAIDEAKLHPSAGLGGHSDMDTVEAALLTAGWTMVKDGVVPETDECYQEWTKAELPGKEVRVTWDCPEGEEDLSSSPLSVAAFADMPDKPDHCLQAWSVTAPSHAVLSQKLKELEAYDVTRDHPYYTKKQTEAELHPSAALGRQKMSPLEAVRQAMFEILRDEVAGDTDEEKRETIELSTHEAGKDPGGWTAEAGPNAAVIVYHDEGVPDAFGSATTFDKYEQIENRASELAGVQLGNQSHNAAVSYFWRA